MPEQAPTLMVPCGHTLCKSCAQSHAACQLCGNIINSLTTNIMLQQIIQEFHGKTQSAAYVQKKIAKYSEAPFYSASKHKQGDIANRKYKKAKHLDVLFFTLYKWKYIFHKYK